MAARSESMPTHQDGSRLSSSLPPPTWFRATLLFGASSPMDSHQGEARLDESTLAQRTTALRHLHGNPKPLSRRPRESKPISGRSSTLVSQPVLVRSYSPDADESPSSSNMPSDTAPSPVEMPTVEDFNIEAILRAIEPEIRSTLDSIAEICGRSRLSLANEYESHIAPFGEVNAFPGGLVTVEEASVNGERMVDIDDNNVVIVDHEDESYSSTLGLLGNLRRTAFATGYQRSTRLQVSNQTHSVCPRGHGAGTTETRARLMPITRIENISTTAKPAGKALLGSLSASSVTAKRSPITSPALLSETHLEAQGNGSSWPSVPPDATQGSAAGRATSSINGHSSQQNQLLDKTSFIAEVQGWLGWLKTIVQREQAGHNKTSLQSHSAELTLRAVLARDQSQAISVPGA